MYDAPRTRTPAATATARRNRLWTIAGVIAVVLLIIFLASCDGDDKTSVTNSTSTTVVVDDNVLEPRDAGNEAQP